MPNNHQPKRAKQLELSFIKTIQHKHLNCYCPSICPYFWMRERCKLYKECGIWRKNKERRDVDMNEQPLYCPRHGWKLENETQPKFEGVSYISEATCISPDNEVMHEVYIENRQEFEQKGNIEIILT